MSFVRYFTTGFSHFSSRGTLGTRFSWSSRTLLTNHSPTYNSASLPTASLYLPPGLGNIEDVEEYRPGGYHPVHIGDILLDKYKVLHKLGSGGFSTTWLVRDLTCKSCFAVKILKAEETALSAELKTLRWLAKLQTDHPGKNFIRHLVDYFVIQGPNGQHNCLVTEVAGPSLQQLYNVSGHGYVAGARRLQADIAQNARCQLVEAVDLLHSHEMCHGDIILSNVLLALQPMNNCTEDEVYERFGKPNRVNLVAASSGLDSGRSAPQYVVEPAGIPNANAPETIFESKLTPASEVWSLACVLFEIRAGNPLFTSIMDGRDEIIQQMVQMKGKLPSQWWEAWEKRSLCFDENGKPLKEWPGGVPMAVEYPLEDMIADIGSEDDPTAMFGSEVSILEPMNVRVPQNEAENMKEVLSSMLQWEPEERLSIRQISQRPWIKR